MPFAFHGIFNLVLKFDLVLAVHACIGNEFKSLGIVRIDVLFSNLTTGNSNHVLGRVKYTDKVYEACTSSFDMLPLGAVMNKQFLCVHGGISPEIQKLDDFKRVSKFFRKKCSFRSLVERLFRA